MPLNLNFITNNGLTLIDRMQHHDIEESTLLIK